MYLERFIVIGIVGILCGAAFGGEAAAQQQWVLQEDHRLPLPATVGPAADCAELPATENARALAASDVVTLMGAVPSDYMLKAQGNSRILILHQGTVNDGDKQVQADVDAIQYG